MVVRKQYNTSAAVEGIRIARASPGRFGANPLKPTLSSEAAEKEQNLVSKRGQVPSWYNRRLEANRAV